MLTDTLYHQSRLSWATRWLKTCIDKPRLIDLDRDHNLVFEYQHNNLVWTPGQVLKLLKKIDQTSAKAVTECCYRLCCLYDDHQDTNAAIVNGLAEHYGIEVVPHTAFWWDWGGVMATVDQEGPAAKHVRWWAADEDQSGAVHLIWLSSRPLHDTLWQHLKARAFAPHRNAEEEDRNEQH